MKNAKILFVTVILCIAFCVTASAVSYDDTPPSNLPYSGGCWFDLNTNLGRASVQVPIDWQFEGFGFTTNNVNNKRIVNIRNTAVSGQMVVGNTTYNIRFQSMGQLEYYYSYQSGNNTYWTWGAVTVNSINATNVKLVDEYGLRDNSNLILSQSEKLGYGLLALIVIALLLLGINKVVFHKW